MLKVPILGVWFLPNKVSSQNLFSFFSPEASSADGDLPDTTYPSTWGRWNFYWSFGCLYNIGPVLPASSQLAVPTISPKTRKAKNCLALWRLKSMYKQLIQNAYWSSHRVINNLLFLMKIFIKYLAMLTISHNVCRTLKLHFNSNVNALCKRIFLHFSICEIKMVKIKGRTQV